MAHGTRRNKVFKESRIAKPSRSGKGEKHKVGDWGIKETAQFASGKNDQLVFAIKQQGDKDLEATHNGEDKAGRHPKAVRPDIGPTEREDHLRINGAKKGDSDSYPSQVKDKPGRFATKDGIIAQNRIKSGQKNGAG